MPFPGEGTQTFCLKGLSPKSTPFNILKLKMPPWLRVHPCSEGNLANLANYGYVYAQNADDTCKYSIIKMCRRGTATAVLKPYLKAVA